MPPAFACLYLHGFLSSPQSQKAQQLQRYFATHLPHATLCIPTLAFTPNTAVDIAEQALLRLQATHTQVLIIGSSLGGFYATYLAQKYDVKAALINPAVRPYQLFADRLGPHQHFYDGNTYYLTAEHLQQLRTFDSPSITQPERLFLLLQTADETLDYREAAQHYQACCSWLESGGNHSFEGFIERLPMLFNWLNSGLAS